MEGINGHMKKQSVLWGSNDFIRSHLQVPAAPAMHGSIMRKRRSPKARFKSVPAWLRHEAAQREGGVLGRQKVVRKRRTDPGSPLVSFAWRAAAGLA